MWHFKQCFVKLKTVGKGDTVHYSQIDENDLAKIYSSNVNVLDTSTPQVLQYRYGLENIIMIKLDSCFRLIQKFIGLAMS